MIDLHTHSTASDGTLPPAAVVLAAAAAGLTGIALTDHDTVLGLAAATAAAAGLTISFVPGVEISAEVDRGALHIVGLYIDPHNSALRAALDEAVENRLARNVKIAHRLTELGKPVSLEEVTAAAQGGVVGRPHFAQLMVAKHYVKNMESAFRMYLAKGRAAYLPKLRMERRRAIELIRESGGVPVLAHPGQTCLKGQELDRLMRGLTDAGLEGIETHCSGYTADMTRQYARLAAKYGLVESGGSDFHGEIKPGIALGIGPGSLHVPDAFLSAMAARAQIVKKSAGTCGNRTHPARC